jgi:hypothetical protein
MIKLIIVHGVGPFKKDDVLEAVRRLSQQYGVSAEGVFAFNWDQLVGRVFSATGFNIGVLSELSVGILNAANLGFLSGLPYVGVPRALSFLLSLYTLVLQCAAILFFPCFVGLFFSERLRVAALFTVAVYLVIAGLALLLSQHPLTAGAAMFRRAVFLFSWPLLYSAALPTGFGLFAVLVIPLMPLPFFFMDHLGTTSFMQSIFYVAAMWGSITAVFLIIALAVWAIQLVASPTLKVCADIFRYIGVPSYREALQGALTRELENLAEGCRHMVVVGHSLGSIIAVDSLLNRSSILERLPRLDLITMGSPLKRVFSRGFPEIFGSPADIFDELSTRYSGFRWINIYRPFDVVGGKLTNVPNAIVEATTEQYFRNHTGYWSDARVVDLVAKNLSIEPKPRLHEKHSRRVNNWPKEKIAVEGSGLLGMLWKEREVPALAIVTLAFSAVALGYPSFFVRAFFFDTIYGKWFNPGFFVLAFLSIFLLVIIGFAAGGGLWFWKYKLKPFVQSFYGTLPISDTNFQKPFPIVDSAGGPPLSRKRLVIGFSLLLSLLALGYLDVLVSESTWRKAAVSTLVGSRVFSLSFDGNDLLQVGITPTSHINLVQDKEACFKQQGPPSDYAHPLGTAVSPNQRFSASITHSQTEHSEPLKSLVITDLSKAPPLPPIRIEHIDYDQLAFSSDECLVASETLESTDSKAMGKITQICGIGSADQKLTFRPIVQKPGRIVSFALGLNGDLLAVLDDAQIYIYGFGKRLASMPYSSGSDASSAFSANGMVLAVSDGFTIDFWKWNEKDYRSHLFLSEQVSATCNATPNQ